MILPMPSKRLSIKEQLTLAGVLIALSFSMEIHAGGRSWGESRLGVEFLPSKNTMQDAPLERRFLYNSSRLFIYLYFTNAANAVERFTEASGPNGGWWKLTGMDQYQDSSFIPWHEVVANEGITVKPVRMTSWVAVPGGQRREHLTGTYVETTPVVTRRRFRNCQIDAIRLATATLNERKSRYGSESEKFRRWLDAQIQVFKICADISNTSLIPESPQPEWEELEIADRQYQIAAAHFYAMHYDEAVVRFGEISQDDNSPWQAISTYLVPRTLLKQAQAGNDDERIAKAREAQSVLEELITRSEMLEAFPSLYDMARQARLLIDPAAERSNLARRILDPNATVTDNDVLDYRELIRRPLTDNEHPMTIWMKHAHRYTRGFRSDGNLAMQDWRRFNSLPFLYMALSRSVQSQNQADLRELIVASENLDPSTRGYVALMALRVRALQLLERYNEAAELINTMLLRDLYPAEHNQFIYLLARQETDFVTRIELATFKPLYYALGGRIVSSWEKYTDNIDVLSDLAAVELNSTDQRNKLLIVEQANIGQFPKKQIALAGWTQAVIEQDWAMARRFAEHLTALMPDLAPEFGELTTSDTPGFLSAYLILKHPGFSPAIKSGLGREGGGDPFFYNKTPVADSAGTPSRRNNWWCGQQQPVYEALSPYVYAQLEQSPDDPRVPEALHRIVFATRHACTSGASYEQIRKTLAQTSRRAFQTLHNRYPGSEWARKTPYWFDR